MAHLLQAYKRFLSYKENRFLKESGDWFGVGRIDEKKKKEIFRNYYRVSFFSFLSGVKNLVFQQNPFDYIRKGWGDNWEMELLTAFLKNEGLIAIKDGRIILKDKNFFSRIPRLRQDEEIAFAVEKKTKTRIRPDEPVTSLIEKFERFEIKENWDQMPISQSSALFCVRKILDYIPLNGKFLFIGDDDFLSVFLCLADPDIEVLVLDADESLLSCIDSLSSRFGLKIKTKKADTRDKGGPGRDFVGFLCNPPYTEKGAEEFLKYGLKCLGKNGGNIFLAIGEENIGSRLLFLQEFFIRKKLLVKEVISGKIFYPYLEIHEKEDKPTFEKLRDHFGAEAVRKNPRLGADLWIFDHIPFSVRRIHKGDSIYDYL